MRKGFSLSAFRFRSVHPFAKTADETGRPFRELVESDARITAHITATELGRLFMPTSYQGPAQTFIDRLVASAQGRTTARRSIDLLMEAKPVSLRTTREAPAALAPVSAVSAPPLPVTATEPPTEKPSPIESAPATESRMTSSGETCSAALPTLAADRVGDTAASLQKRRPYRLHEWAACKKNELSSQKHALRSSSY